MQAHLSDPTDPETFACSKLDLSERQHHAQMYALHRDLLRLRQTEPVFRSQRRVVWMGRYRGQKRLCRFFRAHGDDRLLVVNLGHALHLNPAPEPLLAPPEGMGWAILLSTEDPRYGGVAQHPLEDERNCIFQAMPCGAPTRYPPGTRGIAIVAEERVIQDQSPTSSSARTGSGGCTTFS